jgi:PH (Pleckstrin Homology) domain-containing protein
MNYRLYPLTRNPDIKDLYIETPHMNPLVAKLSSSLEAIKHRRTEQSEQRYDNRLLRFYKNQHTLHELQDAGLTNFDLHRRESRHIVGYLHGYEHIKAAVRGKLADDGWSLLVATNLRIIYLHQIPLFSHMDEISYDLVSGVTCNQVGNWYGSLTLHTRTKDYELNFVSIVAANKFANFVERMAIDRDVMKDDLAKQMKHIHRIENA